MSYSAFHIFTLSVFTFFSGPHVGRPTVGTKSFDSASDSILSNGPAGYMTNRSSCCKCLGTMITYLPLLIVSLPILKLNVEICQSHSFPSSIFLIVSTGLCDELIKELLLDAGPEGPRQVK